ncbi:MAG: putative Ig domain-containing protein [Paenibacillaceae bacterium]
MRRKRREKNKNTIRKVAKILTLSIAATLLVMTMPTLVGAATIKDIPVVEQHIDDYLAEYIDSELDGSLIIGDSITIDLDDIFLDWDSLFYTVITYNSNVAAVTLLSGELHIEAKHAGSTMVQVISRTSEEGTPVYEQFQLSVASIDLANDGIEIDDIVRFINTNPGRLNVPATLQQLLQDVDTVATPVNEAPTTFNAPYHLSLTVDDQVTLDMDDFFSDPDGDPLTYELTNVPANGSIVGVGLTGDELIIEGSTLETMMTVTASDGIAGHQVATKQFHITILNAAPTSLSLPSLSLAENSLANIIVGVFSTTDPNVGDVHTYSLESGLGSDDNGSFMISGNSLIAVAGFDYEMKNSYTIRARVTDQDGLYIEQAFTISVTDVNEAPVVTEVAYTIADQTVYENALFYFVVDTFSDMDEGDMTYTAELSDGAALPSWLIFNPITREFSGTPIHDSDAGDYIVKVTASDGLMNASTEFTLTVIAVNDAPVALHESVHITLYDQQSVEIDMSQYFTDEEGDQLDITYSIGGIYGQYDPGLVNYDGNSHIFSVGYSGALTSPTDISISFFADDPNDIYDPTLSTINVNYVTEDMPPSYLYVDPNSTRGLANFFVSPNYNDQVSGAMNFAPKTEADIGIVGVSLDAAGMLHVTSNAQMGNYNYVQIEASDENGATILKQVKIIVDKEIKILPNAPVAFYGSQDGDVYFNVDLTGIFDTMDTSFDHFSINQYWNLSGTQIQSGESTTDGSYFTNPNLFFIVDYLEIPKTLTIQAHDYYGNIVAFDIALKINHDPQISYNNNNVSSAKRP